MTDVVFTRLHDAIVSGVLIPGETLDNQAVEAWSGASRTPIREALDRLSAIGLVVVAPQRATRVAEDTPDRYQHTMDTLAMFVPEWGASAVPALPAGPSRSIQRALRRTDCDTRALFAADGVLADLLEYAGNARIVQMWSELTPYARRHWSLTPDRVPPLPSTTRSRLADAISDSDPDAFTMTLRAWFTQPTTGTY